MARVMMACSAADSRRVGIGQFPALRAGEELVRIRLQGFFSGHHRRGHFGERRADKVRC